jgi:hypothetical protein
MEEEKTCIASDFTYSVDNYLFVHNPTDFMLDADFVLLFEDQTVINIFNGSTGYSLSPETLADLRSIVLEHTEEVEGS